MQAWSLHFFSARILLQCIFAGNTWDSLSREAFPSLTKNFSLSTTTKIIKKNIRIWINKTHSSAITSPDTIIKSKKTFFPTFLPHKSHTWENHLKRLSRGKAFFFYCRGNFIFKGWRGSEREILNGWRAIFQYITRHFPHLLHNLFFSLVFFSNELICKTISSCSQIFHSVFVRSKFLFRFFTLHPHLIRCVANGVEKSKRKIIICYLN